MRFSKKERMVNLTKLADYLENHITDAQFDMANYRASYDPTWKVYESVLFRDKNNCGSIGCALGWAPFAVEPEKDMYYNTVLKFYEYEEMFVRNDHEFSFLFSSDWAAAPRYRTRKAAIRRIRLLAKLGSLSPLWRGDVKDVQFTYAKKNLL